MNVQNRRGWVDCLQMRVVLLLAVMLLVGVCVANTRADAVPTMSVTGGLQGIDDYDPFTPGLESYWKFNVSNTSPAGDIYNMISFSYPAGSSVDAGGVFYVEDVFGFSASLLGSTIELNGLCIPAGNFDLGFYAYGTTVGQAYATAVAVGLGENPNIPFPPVLVDVPVVPEPAGMGLVLAATLLGLGRRGRSKSARDVQRSHSA